MKKKESSRRNPQGSYGVMNVHTVGRLMKDAVRYASMFIASNLHQFDVTAKATPGKVDDLFTTVDTGAQDIYYRFFTESFPTYGFIGEEGNLCRPCRNRRGLCFTCDPIDGTKAFVRGEPFGSIGTMIALAEGDQIISAWVGDVKSQQIFGFRPGSVKTHCIVGWQKSTHLNIDPKKTLAEQYVLLRNGPESMSTSMSRLVRSNSRTKIFKKYEVYGGSIGTWAVRLWTGNVGGLVLDPGHDAPWDIWPIIGICKHMGFVFLRFKDDKLVIADIPVTSATVKRDYELLIVHESRIPELRRAGLMYMRGALS